jgi:hypothetical protein
MSTFDAHYIVIFTFIQLTQTNATLHIAATWVTHRDSFKRRNDFVAVINIIYSGHQPRRDDGAVVGVAVAQN